MEEESDYISVSEREGNTVGRGSVLKQWKRVRFIYFIYFFDSANDLHGNNIQLISFGTPQMFALKQLKKINKRYTHTGAEKSTHQHTTCYY